MAVVFWIEPLLTKRGATEALAAFRLVLDWVGATTGTKQATVDAIVFVCRAGASSATTNGQCLPASRTQDIYIGPGAWTQTLLIDMNPKSLAPGHTAPQGEDRPLTHRLCAHR
jgi:hypothetical protein